MFVMWCVGTMLTIYVIDSYILSHFRAHTVSTGKPVVMLFFSVSVSHIKIFSEVVT